VSSNDVTITEERDALEGMTTYVIHDGNSHRHIHLDDSEVAALRAYFAAERVKGDAKPSGNSAVRMPEDVQKLVGRLRQRAIEFGDGGATQGLLYGAAAALEAAQRPPVMDEIEFRLSLIKEARAERDGARAAIESARRALVSAVDGPSMTIDAKAAIQGVLEALAHVPAAQCPPVSGSGHDGITITEDEWGLTLHDGDAEVRLDARYLVKLWEHHDAQRPPVSPEVPAVQCAWCDNPATGSAESPGNGLRYPTCGCAGVDGTFAPALSVPSQPIYDEEKIARWLHDAPGLDWLATTPQELASDLAAALPGLTKEENR
jgi:hypothetical protein